eukprot:TRINITY_DN6866_c0_g1_i1.p1 TRINITY_DN6866_c0_g1~~TRINITY_DN6866_c0_g1_i1.p1  ORF type:complete len:360 (+),score=70.29 TRINITY_DN6866_c0_g1_i1:257-1336(+)
MLMAKISSPASLKYFGAMVISMSKIGSDLYFKISQDNMYMTCMNQSKSALFNYELSDKFFQDYQYYSENDQDLNCILEAKSVAGVFKHLKNVETCVIKIHEREEFTETRFEMVCTSGLKKTFVLEANEISPIFPAVDYTNYEAKITSSPSVLIDALKMFDSGLVEVSFVLSQNDITVRSYFDEKQAEGGLKRKPVLTETNIPSNEFEDYFPSTSSNMELVFNAKDMRAILEFCHNINSITLNIYSMGEGDPLYVIFNVKNAFAAVFILATLDLSSVISQSTQTATQTQTPKYKYETSSSVDVKDYSLSSLSISQNAYSNIKFTQSQSQRDDISSENTRPLKRMKLSSDDSDEPDMVWDD